MNRLEDIQSLLHDKETTIDTASVMALSKSHPTCVVPIAVFLSKPNATLSDDQRQELQKAVVLGCSDIVAITDLANLSGCDWSELYPHLLQSTTPTTVETIDKFLDTYGKGTAKEDSLLERLIFNPVAPDYFQGLETPYNPSDPLALPPELMPNSQEPEKPKAAEPTEKINDYPEEEAEPTLPTEGADGNDNKPREEPLLMESLAKIFIKQRRYERAYEIITNLSLKNPEKSAYFADQLRFLQKLIVNQRSIQRKMVNNEQ